MPKPEHDERLRPLEAPVARLHLRSTLHRNHDEIEDYCVPSEGGMGCAGLGWGNWEDARARLEWEDYVVGVRAKGETVDPSVERLHRLPVGSIMWTRARGSYWLGEITGKWEYWGDETARALDLFNRRPCVWYLVGTEDSVPGKIVNNFRASRTLNPVTDGAAVRYSRRLLAQVSGHDRVLEPVPPGEVIASLLGARDLEDLVAAYLQDRHDFVLVSRGESTAGYEYVLRHRKDGRHAVGSVKSGSAAVDLSALPDDPSVESYIYSVTGACVGDTRSSWTQITTDDLVGFVLERKKVLPEQVTRWLSI